MKERASALVHAPISLCISLILILLWSGSSGLAANPAPGAGATSRIRQLLADKHHASTPNPADVSKTSPPGTANASSVPTNEVVSGEILVKVRQGSALDPGAKKETPKNRVAPAALEDGSELKKALLGRKAQSIGPVWKGPASGKGLEKQGKAKPESGAGQDQIKRWYHIKLAAQDDPATALQELRALAEVEHAEPNGYYRVAGTPSAATDPGFAQQWHFAAAKIPDTWQLLSGAGIDPGGSRDVVVAIVDTGIDYNHEDLKANMWVNGGEIPGNRIDDDGNGYVDDVHGCSTAFDPQEHSGDPLDLHYHGTHVAGIVAAVANNSRGGAGVAYNVQLMGVRAAQPLGILTYVDIAEGILYAVDNGAEVINMSFGGFYNSQMIEEALAVAFSQAVLVAAAGNGIAGQGVAADMFPFYPAALPWVLGVMASNPTNGLCAFSNYDNKPHTEYEYEVAAPGQDIYSTMPGNKYGPLSGTSMAAPVVAGAAALLRSYYADRAVYSSRYIMGQVYSTTSGVKGSKEQPPVINPPGAVLAPAKPSVQFVERYLMDDKTIYAGNNNDGGLDAGETVHLGVVLINMMGTAVAVEGVLSSEDPFVTVVTSHAGFDSMGPLSQGNNGFDYNALGELEAITRPFVFRVAPNCPNGQMIPLAVNLTYRNGMDPGDATVYTKKVDLFFIVVRGRLLPRVISQNLDMTAADFWIVRDAVLIEPQATVRIGPGTYVQWGGISDDPYDLGAKPGSLVVRGKLIVEGSAAEPVNCFPGVLVGGQTTVIQVQEGGRCTLRYARMRNARIEGAHSIDHCYFENDGASSSIVAQIATHTIFHRLSGNVQVGKLDGCIMDAGTALLQSGQIYNTVFLQENEANHARQLNAPLTLRPDEVGRLATRRLMGSFPGEWFTITNLVHRDGKTYAALPLEGPCLKLAEVIANYYGGHAICVNDQQELEFLRGYVNTLPAFSYYVPITFYVGLSDDRQYGVYEWVDGSPFTMTNWAPGCPSELSAGTRHVGMLGNGWINVDAGFWATGATPVPFSHWFPLELPGTLTGNDVVGPIQDGRLLVYVLEHYRGDIRFNAFLSKYWDLNVNSWMRFIAQPGAPWGQCSIQDNYFGTTSTNLLNHAIVDYTDNFTSAKIVYQPLPTNGYASCYPFVEQVQVNGTDVQSIPTLGPGVAEFRIRFNRDMDMAVQPFVAFGPSAPFTDFVIPSRGNGWENARTWVGSFNVNPMTGQGYHMMRISGAVANDDRWLVSGYDVARFRFMVKTMGVSAMTLQASGEEGQIRLSWQQDDFALLAGYNLYRADEPDGVYRRLNTTVIPRDEAVFIDTNVVPARVQYYRFTVVQTDLQESDVSNTASAAALDTVAPVLMHTPIMSAPPGRGLRLTAAATDNVGIQNVEVNYRPAGGTNAFVTVAMANVSGNEWSCTIPGSAMQAPGIEYYLVASDGVNLVFSGTAAVPHTVQVIDAPAVESVTPNHGPAEGGTVVTLSGVQFQEGARVFFGGVEASNVVMVTAFQISCVTPAHFPASVDVRILNLDGKDATLLNAYQFKAEGVPVSLPILTAESGAAVELSVTIGPVSGWRAVSLEILFDPSVVEITAVRAGTCLSGWAFSANTNTPGKISLSAAGATPVVGPGVFAIMSGTVVGRPPASTTLGIGSVLLNDGAISAVAASGYLTVSGHWSLAGSIHQFTGWPLTNAHISLLGAGTQSGWTGDDGAFSFTNLPTAAYQLVPVKTNQVAGITAYDAALILQSENGLVTLTEPQRVAADVNQNGWISSMDAAYVLERSVGLLNLPFPGAGRVWDFMPRDRNYSLLASDLTGQNFIAVLLGDVSGNGADPLPPPAAVRQMDGIMSLSGAAASCQLAVDRGWPGDSNRPTRILVRSVEPIYSLDLLISLTSTSAPLPGFGVGAMAHGFMLASNTNQPLAIRVALAGAAGVQGEGPVLAFDGNCDIQLLQAAVNEGAQSAEIQPTSSEFDRDQDGLLDFDEAQFFQTDPTRVDSDGDGGGDGDEVAAGTNPLDSKDVFRILGLERLPGDNIRLRWACVSGKSYEILTGPSPGGTTWTVVHTTSPQPGQVAEVTFSATDGAGATFYRVRVVQTGTSL